MAIVAFLGKRVAALIITISVMLAVAYLLMHSTPGSFLTSQNMASYLGQLKMENRARYNVYIAQFNNRYGLTRPLYAQVGEYVWHSLTFNFGTSFENQTVPILQQLKTAFPISMMLAFGSVAVAILVGIPLGIAAALKRNTWIDATLSTLSVAGQAVPSYVLAVLLVLLFGVVVPGILPVNGWGSPGEVVLPIVAVSAGNIGIITRYTRGSLIEVLRQDYVRAAEAKGVRRWPLVFHHGLRNSLTALLTVIGPTFAFTVISTVWVEQAFSIPGMGNLLAQAFPDKDIPLSITSVYILCLLVMGMNIVVDLLYQLLDPRVQMNGKYHAF